MKNLIVLALALGSFNSLNNGFAAETSALQINDPSGFLNDVDTFIGHPTFESAFDCGTRALYEVNRCGNGGCFPTEQVTETVVDCQADQITLRGDASYSQDWVITRANYEAANGNLLRANLAHITLGPNDSINIESSATGNYSLTDGTQIPFFAVNLTIYVNVQYPNGTWGYEQFPLQLAVGSGVTGVSELLWSAIPGSTLPAAYRLLSASAN